MVAVSVVVCTRDRPRQLGRMLQSAAALSVPAGLDWEMLIVDNGSPGQTAAVVESFAGVLPIRRVAEPVPGISRARNRGSDEARGRYICWTDDDVLLDPHWLAAYLEAFRRHPDATLFGGTIRPELVEPTPDWCRRGRHQWPLSAMFVERDPGADRPILLHDQTPWGANFAVRADEQRRLRYDVALGVAPGRSRTGEECDLIYRLLKGGAIGWWVAGAMVRHIIEPERQRRGFLLRYFRQAGETAAYLNEHFPGDNKDEARGAAGFARMSDAELRLRIAAHRLCGNALWAGGLRCSSLRFLAARALYGGVLSHRRRRGAATPGLLEEQP
ncbi:MAG: putative glycosyltransferase [Alphaproteobacteria bacterium]|nr:putative glycosyltransferase [Alphaproteobacteria bacterium]